MNSYSYFLAWRKRKPERSAWVGPGFKHLLAIHFNIVVRFGFQPQNKSCLIVFLRYHKSLALFAKADRGGADFEFTGPP